MFGFAARVRSCYAPPMPSTACARPAHCWFFVRNQQFVPVSAPEHGHQGALLVPIDALGPQPIIPLAGHRRLAALRFRQPARECRELDDCK